MAQKRMFSLSVTDTDAFQDMPTSSQALYFHLGMHGDDDGFVDSPKKIARAAGCNNDDLKVLAAKGFIIPFDSGIIVIRHWLINNTLKNDRYHETLYLSEKHQLQVDTMNSYQLCGATEPARKQDGSRLEPELNLTELNLTEQRESRAADKPPRAPRFIPPTVDEVMTYCSERKNSVDAQRFVDFYESKNWMVGKNKMRDWKAAVRGWERNTEKPAASDRNTVHSDAEYEGGWD